MRIDRLQALVADARARGGNDRALLDERLTVGEAESLLAERDRLRALIRDYFAADDATRTYTDERWLTARVRRDELVRLLREQGGIS